MVYDYLRTNSENFYAMGEFALHNKFIYGLILPGYGMAKVAAKKCAHQMVLLNSAEDGGSEKKQEEIPTFTGADL